MRFFDRFSIRAKLVAILLILSAISLCLGFAFVIFHDISTFKGEMVENGVTVARVIGDYSVVDLTFQDPAASRETLAKLNSIPDVDCAFLYDARGSLFSAYTKANCPAPEVQNNRVEFRGQFLHIFKPVEDKQRKLGTIYVRISTLRLQQKVRSYLLTMLLLAGCLIVISFLLAVRFQRIISIPLIQLAGATRRIGDEADYSVRVKHESGDEIKMLFDGFNSMVTQIEKRRGERDRAEKALRESEDRYRVLVESSPVAVFLESQGRIVYVNPAAIALSGYASLSDLNEVKFQSLIGEQTDEVALAKYDALPAESIFVRKDNTRLEVEVMKVQTTHQGQPAVQYVIRDVTESKSLRLAAQRMERLAALGEFSAMLAHEMRNSIGSIALNVRMLRERFEVPDPYRKNLQSLEKAVERIQAIIKAILDFARPAPPKLQPISINRVLESSLHQVEHEMEGAGIVVSRLYDASEPLVAIDVHQISQVFVNLLLNAKHAIDGDGKITVITDSRGDSVDVRVVDTGKGIPPENMQRIFDPFFTTSSSGVGLGLAFVSRILEQHGAHIFVESTLGKGSTFTVRFARLKNE
jgi:PAS domain S-box-containing protein